MIENHHFHPLKTCLFRVPEVWVTYMITPDPEGQFFENFQFDPFLFCKVGYVGLAFLGSVLV